VYLKNRIIAHLKLNFQPKGIIIELFTHHLMITKLMMNIFIKHRKLMLLEKHKLKINTGINSKRIQRSKKAVDQLIKH